MGYYWEDHGQDLNNRYLAGLNRDQGQSASAEDEYYSRAKSFDPQASLSRYAHGAYDEIFNGTGGVGDQLTALKGASVGSGRLNTGFFDRDQGQIELKGMADLNSRINQGAMQATGMQLQNNEDIGQYGQAVRSRYLDMLSGAMDRAHQEAQTRQSRNWGRAITGFIQSNANSFSQGAGMAAAAG